MIGNLRRFVPNKFFFWKKFFKKFKRIFTETIHKIPVNQSKTIYKNAVLNSNKF